MSESSRPTFHTNFVQVHGTAFDVALDFSYRAKQDEESEPVLVRITMSWEHAAAIVPVIQNAVSAYQEEVGPLPPIVEVLSRSVEEANK